MSLFSGLFKSRDKPQNRTAGSNYAFFFGGTTSGKAVTERSAMQMTAVYSCVRILSEAVAGLPLHLYKYTDSGGKAMALDHPLYRLLHDEPNPEMSSFVFRETLMTHLLLWGNAYTQIIRNGKNEIVALYPLMPNKMSVDRDENGRLYYTYYRGNNEATKNKEYAVTLQPSEVLHIPGLGFDGWSATAPSLWRRMPSAWLSPVRNTEPNSSPTVLHLAVCWNIPARSKTRSVCVRVGSLPSAAAAMPIRSPCWKKA